MERVAGYPKINADGKMRVWDERNKDWWIEEKIDGSQLSFRVITTFDHEHMIFYNRGKEINQIEPGWVFEAAMAALGTLKSKLVTGIMYHGECIVKCKHNVVRYGRVPRLYFVLFDMQYIVGGVYVSRNDMEAHAVGLGLECTPVLYANADPAIQPGAKAEELIAAMTAGCSLLGGEDLPEGVVIKHHSFVRSENGRTVASKIKVVREEFKEEHRRPKKNKDAAAVVVPQTLTAEESLERIMSWFPKEARWQKAKQRLRDQGLITGEPENSLKERNAIREETRRDFKDECKEPIKSLLWAEFAQRLVQSITDGCE
jgi:hypothetical protein